MPLLDPGPFVDVFAAEANALRRRGRVATLGRMVHDMLKRTTTHVNVLEEKKKKEELQLFFFYYSNEGVMFIFDVPCSCGGDGDARKRFT